MEENDRNKVIKEKLNAMGEDYDSLKPFLKDYLDRIEKIIHLKESEQVKVIKNLKDTSYTVSDISNELNCSRTTLYNHNQLLKRYIEYSIKMSNKDNPYHICETLKELILQLKEQVTLMENRDIDFELIKQEKNFLQEKVAEQTKEIQRLQNRVFELSNELHKYKQKMKQTNTTSIIKF